MSLFIAICPVCRQKYLHCFVGTELISGHKCPGKPKDSLTFGAPANTKGKV